MTKIRQTITPAERDRRVAGCQYLAPGIWVDADENIHFSIPELLAAFGWPDDPQHRALVQQTVEELCHKEFPTTTIVDVDVES